MERAGVSVCRGCGGPGISPLTIAAESASLGADEDVPPIPVAAEEDRRRPMRALRREAEALHHPVRFVPDQQPGAVSATGRHPALAQGQAGPAPKNPAANPGSREELRPGGGAVPAGTGAGLLEGRAA